MVIVVHACSALLALATVAWGVHAAPSSPLKRASGDSLASIDHVILFMQENRAFDHYYGGMAGVRGFQDPNALINSQTGKNVFHQPVNSNTSPAPPIGVSELLPFHINAAGGDSEDRYQCMVAGSNGWAANHAFWNRGQLDTAPNSLTPYSMGFYQRADLPFHYALADAYTIGDAYHESVIAETDPNRMSWGASTNGILQAQKGLNGPVLDNNASPGCVESKAIKGFNYTCFPFEWKTVAEYLQDANISWKTYQDQDNFDDNPLQYFKNFIDADVNSPLAQRGMRRDGLQQFYDQARNGTLPEVSFIIGPADLSEHPPYGPLDGAWLQEQVVQSVLAGPAYDKSALIISYDETGGWMDHVISPLPPAGTAGEYIQDFYNASLGIQPNGPGFRVPLVVVSPWSRGGNVFAEVGAHESQILFLEQWAKARGKPFQTAEMTTWRRQQLSDLTRAFDFSHKDTSIPTFAPTRMPTQDSSGDYNGGATCQAKYPDHQPAIPYGKQTDATALAVETGFKQVRGNPSEGRLLTFEYNGLALAYDAAATHLTVSTARAQHNNKLQRFILHAVQDTPSNTQFHVQTASATTNKYVTSTLQLTTDASQAGTFTITDQGNGQGYAVKEGTSQARLTMQGTTPVFQASTMDQSSASFAGFSLFSVTG